MARGRCKVNTDALDAKIEQQKAALEKAKAKYTTLRRDNINNGYSPTQSYCPSGE